MKITKQRIVTRLILEKNRKILLLKRPRNKGGNYSLVGGHVEQQESILQALKRETFEEAGIIVKRKHLELVHVAHRNKTPDYVLYIFFLAKKWKGEIINREPGKCESLDWFQVDHLPKNLSPTTHTALKSFQAGNYYSDIDWRVK